MFSTPVVGGVVDFFVLAGDCDNANNCFGVEHAFLFCGDTRLAVATYVHAQQTSYN